MKSDFWVPCIKTLKYGKVLILSVHRPRQVKTCRLWAYADSEGPDQTVQANQGFLCPLTESWDTIDVQSDDTLRMRSMIWLRIFEGIFLLTRPKYGMELMHFTIRIMSIQTLYVQYWYNTIWHSVDTFAVQHSADIFTIQDNAYISLNVTVLANSLTVKVLYGTVMM